jgi:hypothetical protein
MNLLLKTLPLLAALTAAPAFAADPATSQAPAKPPATAPGTNTQGYAQNGCPMHGGTTIAPGQPGYNHCMGAYGHHHGHHRGPPTGAAPNAPPSPKQPG